MVEMVRSGTLNKDDRVRRDGSDQWTPAGEIIGLFRVAEKEQAQTPSPEPDAGPNPVTDAVGLRGPLDEGPFRRRLGGLVWIVGGALVVVSVALGAWQWSRTTPPRFPEPLLGSPAPPPEDDTPAALSDAMATFSQVIGEGKTPKTEQLSFTSAKRVEGIVVAYKCHSQSESNYEENTVELTLRRGEEVLGEWLDSYESQTDWGDVSEFGFWHSKQFADVSLAAGDRVDLTITVKAGDYLNWVSEIRICPWKKGASYPDDREFHGSL
jgi:hypothetical protein